MNKSVLLTTGALLALAATPLMAQEAGSSRSMPGFIDYAGVGLAISDVTDLDNGTALVVNAGKNISSIPGLAAEGEFTTTVSKPSATLSGVSADASYWTLAGYGVYTLPVTQQLDVRGRLGVLYEHLDVSGGAAHGDKDDFTVSAGVGASWNLTQRVALTADYTRITEDINHFGAGVRFRF